MIVQLRHLRYFVATAVTGTASAAAVAEHVTQPALSRQLRQLEDDLGVELFDRTAGRLVLSGSGRALLPGARDILRSAEALEDLARLLAHGRVERVVIAAPTVTLTDVVSSFVATMGPEDPVIEVQPADGLTPRQMLDGGADLAIGTQRPPEPYLTKQLADLPVWAYVRSDDPWRGRLTVTLEELLDRTVVRLPPTSTARVALDAALEGAGRSPSQTVEAANGTIAQALAASGRGVAVVSDDPRYGLRPLRVDTGDAILRIRLSAVWDPRAVAAPAIEALVTRLGRWVAHRYPESAADPSP